ncbi:MAG: tautomerase family protein, partial [Burkholderiaceae bacterium]|nr:tautomerase family protein [Burkholderiaceae bacterium]
MPTFHVEMFEGRTAEQKKKLVAEVTRVTVET